MEEVTQDGQGAAMDDTMAPAADENAAGDMGGAEMPAEGTEAEPNDDNGQM